jgi:hypothetical protein
LLEKYVGQRKVERPLKGGEERGEWYINKDLFPRGRKGTPLNLLPRGESQYKPKLLMGWWGER